MLASAVAALGGTIVALWFPQWCWPLAAALSVVAAFGWRYRQTGVMIGAGAALLGLALAGWTGSRVANAQWQANGAARDVVLDGYVSSLPVAAQDRVRFVFSVYGAGTTRKLRVNDYSPERSLAAGERWQLCLRLRPPRGDANPAGFDYTPWLFQRRIHALAYVRDCPLNRRLPANAWRLPVLRVRAWLRSRIELRLPASRARALLLGLGIGDRGAIDAVTWEALRRTGTTHLVAISGLHVGLVSGLAFVSMRWFAGWLPLRRARLAALEVGLISAVVAATAYAALAGFPLPARRALLMCLVVVIAARRRRHVTLTAALGVALWFALLNDPLAPLTVGFWLSFGAVATLLAVSAGRRPGQKFAATVRAQAAVWVGLFPVLARSYGAVSLSAPVVNLIAVPFFGLCLLPLTLAATFAAALGDPFAGPLLHLAGALLDLTLASLLWLAADERQLLTLAVRPAWLQLLALIAAALLLAPRGLPGRWLAGLFAAIWITWQPPRPPVAAAWAQVLAVGHGVAVVVQTRRHTLIYDTGDRLADGSALATRVLLPFLAARGIRQVDAIVISHADRDHAGGLETLLRDHPTALTYAGEPLPVPARPCQSGHSWRWDGVEFRFLHPSLGEGWTGNDASCVLSVRGPGGSLLLTGDIEIAAEWRLAFARPAHWTEADVVLGPHHGSGSSSSAEFIAATGARHVVFSNGAFGPWELPQAKVLARWRAAGAATVQTGEAGAVSIVLDPENGVSVSRGQRHSRPRAWRN